MPMQQNNKGYCDRKIVLNLFIRYVYTNDQKLLELLITTIAITLLKKCPTSK